jgi:hypothetical protein
MLPTMRCGVSGLIQFSGVVAGCAHAGAGVVESTAARPRMEATKRGAVMQTSLHRFHEMLDGDGRMMNQKVSP